MPSHRKTTVGNGHGSSIKNYFSPSPSASVKKKDEAEKASQEGTKAVTVPIPPTAPPTSSTSENLPVPTETAAIPEQDLLVPTLVPPLASAPTTTASTSEQNSPVQSPVPSGSCSVKTNAAICNEGRGRRRLGGSDASSTESNSSTSPGLKKTEPKKKKFKKSVQRYAKDWEKKLRWLTESQKGIYHGYCSICEQDIKCTGGLFDLERHDKTTKHISNSKQIKVVSNADIMDIFLSKRKTTTDSELRLCAWGAQRNVAISIVESFATVAKDIFPDSKIAQAMKLGRTKITAIHTKVLGSSQTEEVVEIMKTTKWSLIVDESTDISGQKTLAMVVRSYKWIGDKLVIRDYFYRVITVTDATAIALYELIIAQFDKDHVPYKENMIELGTDGANVMMGQHHSVAAFFRRDCPGIFLMKCICHSFALCASHACKNIPSEVEQLCRDVYNFLKYGGQRAARFKELQSLMDLQPHKMLHPSATRWLSLEAVVQRMLEQYDVLLMFFSFIDNRADKSTREKQGAILRGLQNPLMKTYLLFLNYILPAVNKLNRLFQSESPELCRLHSDVSQLYRTVLDNFMHPNYMRQCRNLSNLSLVQSNCKELHNMYIGTAAKVQLDGIMASKQINSNDATQFLTNIMKFYISLANQIHMRFDFDDPVFVNITIIDPRNVIDRSYESMLPLIQAFPNLVGQEFIQELDSEYREVRNVDFKNYKEEERRSSSKFWCKVLSSQHPNGEFMFPRLRKFIAELLILPHSSASVERLFSDYNLNKSKPRNRLSERTMQGLLATKDYVKTHTDEQGKLQITESVRKSFNSDMYKTKTSPPTNQLNNEDC